jgi:hypothetical protein
MHSQHAHNAEQHGQQQQQMKRSTRTAATTARAASRMCHHCVQTLTILISQSLHWVSAHSPVEAIAAARMAHEISLFLSVSMVSDCVLVMCVLVSISYRPQQLLSLLPVSPVTITVPDN